VTTDVPVSYTNPSGTVTFTDISSAAAPVLFRYTANFVDSQMSISAGVTGLIRMAAEATGTNKTAIKNIVKIFGANQ